MWEILKNEWRSLSRSKLLLGVSTAFALVLIVSVYLGYIQTQRQTVTYQTAQNHIRGQWENIKEMNPHGAAHYGSYVFKPTSLLGSLDEGVNSITGNILRLEGHVQNEMVHSEASQMQAISKFGKLKSALLLQYIVPLLLIFLAFNALSSEKQSGRLKLLIIQGAKPFQINLAKTFAVWLFGIALLTLVVIANSLIHFRHLNVEIIVRTALFFFSYALFYFVITGLTVSISAAWQNATVALTSMLGIWILWTIFLPNIIMSSVEKWHPLPSRNTMKLAMKEDRAKGVDGHNPADERQRELEKEVLLKYNADSLSQLPFNFDGLVMQADEEYGNLVWDKHFGNISHIMAKQKQRFQLSGIFNPFVSVQNASRGFTATDNLHHQTFLVDVEQYRRTFIKLLNDKHAFGGSKTGDWQWKADNSFYKSVPDFVYKPTPISAVLHHYAVDLGFLIFWTALTFFLLRIGAKKMQLL